MRYFLDTEFNGFGGELISIALVPEFGDQEYYAILPLTTEPNAWVALHVLPYLLSVPPGLVVEPMPRAAVAREIAHFLSGDTEPVIVADWPEDIAQFNYLLCTGPGTRETTGLLGFSLLDNPGLSTAETSQVPHNALHDARALRTLVLGSEA
jgi:hypothetical protein